MSYNSSEWIILRVVIWNPIQHRHDLSDHAWSLLEPHLLGQAGQWGGIARDNRRFLNAVFWILRSGAPWRDLPSRLRRLEEYPPPFLPLAR